MLYKRVLDVNKGLLCLWVVEDHLSPEVVSQIQTQAAQPNPGTPGASAKSTPIHGLHVVARARDARSARVGCGHRCIAAGDAWADAWDA